jgi:diacylglycerol diphosphate phosphatase/phosphatidate phosphatase
MVAISRWEDYRHGVYDISAGSILGLVVAHFAYRKYFPALRSSRCDIPFPVPGDTVAHKQQDIEMGHAGNFELANDDESEEHLPLTSARS